MRTILSKRKFTFLLGLWLLCCTLFAAAGMWFLYTMETKERVRVSIQAKAESRALANLLEPVIAATTSIGTIIEWGLTQDQLEELIGKTLKRWPLTREIAVAPDGIIDRIYPTGTDSATLGLNLLTTLDTMEEAMRARDTRSLIIAGPYTQQGGEFSLSICYPVFRGPFWGFVISEISFNSFLAQSGLFDLESRGYRWALVNPDYVAQNLKHPLLKTPVNSQDPRLFAGTIGKLPKDPVLQEVPLSNTNWILEMEPVGGWNLAGGRVWIILIACILGFLVSFTITKILSYNRRLAHEVGERVLAEGRLQKLLAEKELLLREIHHRVKNNLSIVESIISLESQRAEDPRYEQVFADLSKRIHSVALIHEKLYRGQDLDRIKARSYIADLVYFIFEGIGRTAAPPIVDVEDLDLTTKSSLSVGLILTELCTNAAKYGQDRQIRIQFRRSGTNLVLRVENEGPPPPEDYRNRGGLGLRLVDSLASQLEGTWQAEAGPPVAFVIEFPAQNALIQN